MSVFHQGKLIAAHVVVARTFWQRLSGYMFRSAPHVPGLLFEGAGELQTTFMRFELDLVFLSRENQVVKIRRGVKPWRFIWSRGKKALELPAGVLPAELSVGDTLEFRG